MDERLPLPALEYHVAHGCNLSCQQCSHYSNFHVAGKLPTVEDAENGPYEPDMPPYPFVPPFDPPGDDPPYEPREPDGPIILTPPPEPPPPVWPDDYPPGTPDFGPRPPWWPEEHFWPPQPDPPVIINAPLPPHIWPRLPTDHPYHVPPGHSYPDNLPPGHPGEAYPAMPDYPVVHPGDWGEDWPSYPGILDDWPPTYEDDEEE